MIKTENRPYESEFADREYESENRVSSFTEDEINDYSEFGYRTEKKINSVSASAEAEDILNAASEGNRKNDSTPTVTTMQYAEDTYEGVFSGEGREAEADDFAISPKGKAMIVVYALVIVTIIALIIMNARLLKNMQESIEREESTVEMLTKRAEDLSEELSYVSDEEVIVRKAMEMGMTR